MLTLTSLENLIANKEIICDASTDFLEQYFNKKIDASIKSKLIMVMFNCRHCRIKNGEAYCQYQFVDEDGEVMEMNCGQKIHAVMVKYRLYPEQVLEAIEQF